MDANGLKFHRLKVRLLSKCGVGKKCFALRVGGIIWDAMRRFLVAGWVVCAALRCLESHAGTFAPSAPEMVPDQLAGSLALA